MEDNNMSVFCNIYQKMSQKLINRISKNCNYQHYRWPMYKKAFTHDNSVATNAEWHDWHNKFQINDWETDIWSMNVVDFKYYWPYHSAFIIEYFDDAGLFEEV